MRTGSCRRHLCLAETQRLAGEWEAFRGRGARCALKEAAAGDLQAPNWKSGISGAWFAGMCDLLWLVLSWKQDKRLDCWHH